MIHLSAVAPRVGQEPRVWRLALVTGLAGLVALVGAGTADAARPSGTPPNLHGGNAGRPDFDLRLAGVRVAPSAAQRATVARLGDVEVGWTELGTPHSLRARSGALTRPSRAEPDAVARAFLRDHAELFRQRPGDIAKLELTRLARDASGIVTLRYRQLHGDRLVYGSSLLVVLDRQGRIWLVGGTLAPSLGPPSAPGLDAAGAVRSVALTSSPRVLPPVARQGGSARIATFENTLALPAMRSPQPVTAELVSVPTADGARAAWRVRSEIASNVDYESLVDASSGEVIYRKNQWSSTGPRGFVHTGDDPEAGGQSTVAFPAGWVDAGGSTTAGNNANAYQDLFDDETPHAADQPSNADQHFDYTFSNGWGTSGVLPTSGADRDAVVTQLFYYTNWFHDYVYALGFTEGQGNFQNDNFGNGGTGGDAVRAEADDSYGDGTTELCKDSDDNDIPCRNNANFNTNGADGSVPRMQMYVGEVDLGGGTFRRTQRAMNRDTVIHEYAHGVTGRTISDGNLAGGVQSGALGEGWGDAFATSINNDPVYGEYNNGDYTNGIRGVAYDDDNLEYGDLCNNGGSNPCQVHDDGRIWAMAMWEQRTALRAKHGNASGKALHERLLMLGIILTPDTPSYHDARAAYLLADALLDFLNVDPDAGNQCLLWRVFADNELGVTAGPDDDDDQTPTVSTATPPACDPEAVIVDTPALTTPEGTALELNGLESDVGGDDGDTLGYAWDLDDDGDFDDSTSATPSVTFGDNGSFEVHLRVTNTAGYSDTDTATVTVTNVAPTVVLDPAQLTTRDEGQALQVQATFSDPGWLDTYTGSVDLGTTYLADVAGTVAVTGQGPPADVGTIDGTVTYGDDGSFTVTVSVTDDDSGTGESAFVVTVSNLDPTATIDESAALEINGVKTIFADAGEVVPLSAQVTDAGSDDETTQWDWDDGSLSALLTSLVNPPAADPASSPTVQPRDVVVADSHAWADACMYDVVFDVEDDDGGTASDTVTVLITAPPSPTRGAGYWQHQYKGNGKLDFTFAELDCYLEIAAFLSDVFNEVRDASTRQKAHDDIFVAGLKGSLQEQLDRQLLTAWVNFANGGVEWTELLDTDGNGTLDTSFVDVITTAEAVRLNPASTRAELEAQRDILMRINGRDGL